MDEFILLVRSSYPTGQALPLADLQLWQEWVDHLKANGNLLDLRPHFDTNGQVLTQDQSASEGPYVEGKATITSLLFIRATDYEAATRIAQGCPTLALGGTVEVRQAQ